MFFPALDVPPEQQEMVECAISAAIKYEIPANIMLAVAEKEGGKTGQWVRNSNGTYDVGYMQFNTAYLKSLKKYGIEAKHVAAGGCYSYDLAAWRISAHLRDGQKGDMWTRVRCQPWRAKRRLVDPSSREAALLTRRAHSARGEAK